MVNVTKKKLRMLAIKCNDVAPVHKINYSSSTEILTIIFEFVESPIRAHMDKVGLFYVKRYVKEIFGLNSELLKEYDGNEGKWLTLEMIFTNNVEDKPKKPVVTILESDDTKKEREDKELDVQFHGIFSFSRQDVKEAFGSLNLDMIVVTEKECHNTGQCNLLPSNNMFDAYIRGSQKILRITFCTSHRFDFRKIFNEKTKKQITELFS